MLISLREEVRFELVLEIKKETARFKKGGRGIGNSKQGKHYTDMLNFMERFLLFQESERSSKSGHTDEYDIEYRMCVRVWAVSMIMHVWKIGGI